MPETLFPVDAPFDAPWADTPAPAPAPAPAAAGPEPAAAGPVEVACDGSCLSNPGPGGWAAAVVVDGVADPHRWQAGGQPGTTNNRMELQAAHAALDAFVAHPGELVLVCDSKYVIDALSKWVHGWRRRGWTTSSGKAVANRDVIEPAVDLLEVRQAAGRATRFRWVRGHTGHAANEFVDDAARAAATAVRDGGAVATGPGLGRS